MKQNQPFKRSGKETLIEIVSLIVFLALAIGIWVFFGMNPFSLNYETLLLIGLGVFAIVGVAIFMLLRYTAKKRNNEK